MSTDRSTDQNTNPTQETPRRTFLLRLATGAAGAGIVLLGPAPAPQATPRERPLREADFYTPHTLAG